MKQLTLTSTYTGTTVTLAGSLLNTTHVAQCLRRMANADVHWDKAQRVASELLSGNYTGGELRRWELRLD